MPLYLITSLIDEGIYSSSFRVVEVPSKLALAEHMLSHSFQWRWFLERSYPRDWLRQSTSVGSLWDCIQAQTLTPEQFLELINKTRVDGDSEAQLAIHEITIHQLSEVDTEPSLL